MASSCTPTVFPGTRHEWLRQSGALLPNSAPTSHTRSCPHTAHTPGREQWRHQGRRACRKTVLPFRMVDLVGALQGLVDLAHLSGHAVRGIKTLVGIHLAGAVAVRRNLPAAHVDGLQSGLNLLDGLVARDRPQRMDVLFAMQQ